MLKTSTNGSRFDNRTKSFITIDPTLLRFSISNKTCLIAFKSTSIPVFMMKQPQTTNNIDPLINM